MKFLLAFSAIVCLVPLAPAKDASFYVGTLTSPTGSKGIYRGCIDTETGKLGPLTLMAPIKDPNFLTLSANHAFLYAALDNSVAAFALQRKGELTLLNEKPSGGDGSCEVSLDRAGHHVFVANYDGGNIACLSVKADGSLGEQTALKQFTGSGPLTRQKKPFAHWVGTDADDMFVYACDLGSDQVWIFNYVAGAGTLAATDPSTAKVPPGSGPRHLAFSANGKFAYVVNEMGNNVTVFSRDVVTGALTALETVSALPPGTSTQGATGAEIAIHPSGKWLYASTRGHDSIAVFSIASDGRLTLIQSASSIAKFPRSFAVDPSGQWLIAAGQNDNRLAVLKIDPTTGHLTATDESAPVGNPVCVLFVPEGP